MEPADAFRVALPASNTRMTGPFEFTRILAGSFTWPFFWPGWLLVFSALVLVGLRNGLSVHCLIAGGFGLLAADLYGVWVGFCCVSHPPINHGQMILWDFAVPLVPLAAAFPPVLWADRHHLPVRSLLLFVFCFVESVGLVVLITATLMAKCVPTIGDILKLFE